MKSYFNSCFLLGIIVFASSCNYTPANERDTPTQGKENICVDESYYVLMSTQVFTFMSKYADATINERYIPEEEAIKALIDDSVDLAVISRELNPNEIAIFKARNIQPRMVEIAKDAVSFIVNKNNPDSVFTKKQIDQILSGKAKNWKDLNNNGSLNSSLVVVLDNQRSSNARYLKDSFIHSNTFPSNITVAGNNMAVFDYVAKYPGAIGIISNGWISDRDDSSCNALLNKISLVAVKKDETSEAFLPLQGYISSDEYPYTRKLYMINTEGGNGLVSGFTSYVAGEKGQLIILKNGIVPAIVPTRTVKINIEH